MKKTKQSVVVNKNDNFNNNNNDMADEGKYKNPFTVPVDHDIFALRDKEKVKKKQEREAQQLQRVRNHCDIVIVIWLVMRKRALITLKPSSRGHYLQKTTCLVPNWTKSYANHHQMRFIDVLPNFEYFESFDLYIIDLKMCITPTNFWLKEKRMNCVNEWSASEFLKSVKCLRSPCWFIEKQYISHNNTSQHNQSIITHIQVHEKTTYTSRINARTKAMIRPAGEEADDLSEKDGDGSEGSSVVKDDPNFVLATTKDRHVEKEHLEEYITKKREWNCCWFHPTLVFYVSSIFPYSVIL